MSKHTPGPWVVVISEQSIFEPLISVIDAKGNTVCDNETYYPAALDPDNASLIASAPDLLEALEAAEVQMFNDLDRIEGEWGMGENIELIISRGEAPAITMARAAIARAKGESQ